VFEYRVFMLRSCWSSSTEYRPLGFSVHLCREVRARLSVITWPLTRIIKACASRKHEMQTYSEFAGLT